ncbi:MAG: molybdenum cofactor biosysynthesis protein [Verrucomicrobia bacterium]|nr:molybdenum cofactor biosysynthesis protein [Verrucomicrobiota bacterium]
MRIRHIFISPGHNFVGHHGKPPSEHATLDVREARMLSGRGIEGDRYLDFKDNYKGQVTFFEWEVYERMIEKFSVIGKGPEIFRRNIITEGVDLNSLIGIEFEVQGVRFLGTQESAPCHWMNHAFAEGAEEALKGHGGLRAKILCDGVLRVDA